MILYNIKYIKYCTCNFITIRIKRSQAVTVTRSNEDIPMQVSEPYVLHQSKPTDDVVYEECQQTTL